MARTIAQLHGTRRERRTQWRFAAEVVRSFMTEPSDARTALISRARLNELIAASAPERARELAPSPRRLAAAIAIALGVLFWLLVTRLG